MNTPQWLESEQHRIKREARMRRIEVGLGVVCVVVWGMAIVEMVVRLVR